MAESDAFPPSNVPAATSADVAVATFQALQETQRAAAAKAVADSEIIDPGQPHAKSAEAEAKGPPKPDLVEGAFTSESIPDSLIERAIALDYTEAEARAMGKSVLQKTVVRLEKREAEARAPRQEFRPTEPEAPDELTLPSLVEGREDGYEYDEKYLKAMSARDQLAMENAKELAELKKKLSEREQNEHDRQFNSAITNFERRVVADEDLHDELGDDMGTPTNRRHLEGRKDMWDVYLQQLNKGKTEDQAYQIARAGLFHEKLQGKVKGDTTKELAGKLKESSKQITRRPSVGKPIDMEPGREKAIRAVKQFQEQNS